VASAGPVTKYVKGSVLDNDLCGQMGQGSGNMARKLRVEYPEAVYHVLNRGNRREAIFRDDTDRQHFVDTLAEACAKASWQVHALWRRAR